MNKFMTFGANVKNAFDNEEIKFKAFSKLMVDTAMGKQEVEKAEANAKIVEIFQNALGIDSETPRNEVRKAIRRNQSVLFDLIEDTIQTLLVTGWQNDPFMMNYVETKNIALGDKNEFYFEDDSVLSVMEVSGNHHDVIRQRIGAGTVTSVATKWVGIKIYSEFERVLTGAEDWGVFVQKVYQAYDYYIKQAIYDTMVGYTSSIPSAYKKTGDVTAANLNDLCDAVAIATGLPVIIMGTRTALSKVIALQNASYISDAMKNEHYTTGTLGQWEGKHLVEIPQIYAKNKEGTTVIDNNMLWIMPMTDSNRFIKVVNEGDTQLKQITDSATNADMTYEYEVMNKIGVGVVFNMRFAMYDIA